jgi:hypothetical protein
MKDPNTILIFAMRYAFNRNSYAPSLVADELINNFEHFNDYDRSQVYNEISSHIKFMQMRARPNDTLRRWEKVLEKFKPVNDQQDFGL